MRLEKRLLDPQTPITENEGFQLINLTISNCKNCRGFRGIFEMSVCILKKKQKIFSADSVPEESLKASLSLNRKKKSGKNVWVFFNAFKGTYNCEEFFKKCGCFNGFLYYKSLKFCSLCRKEHKTLLALNDFRFRGSLLVIYSKRIIDLKTFGIWWQKTDWAERIWSERIWI